MAKYELLADEYHETTSKPGEPFTYQTHTKGAKVELDAEQARRLIEAGAFKANTKDSGPVEVPGDQPKAPKGDADEDATDDVGDGNPDPLEPAGTGSTHTGDGGGPGDGQGSAANNPEASTARRGRRSGGTSA
jgi:hypothetical protein